MSAGAIRAGAAYVELFVKDTIGKGLAGIAGQLKSFGGTVTAAGAGLMKLGLAATAPLVGAVKQYADYEQALAGLRAVASPTADQLGQVEASVDALAQATGTAPTEVVGAFTELIKAGLPLQQILGGAGEAVLKFARAADMEVAPAAVALTDALNVFRGEGLSAAGAADILTKAANASSISVQDVMMSFSQASAVAAGAGLTMEETASAIALLGSEGIKGSDAGTSLKTMLNRLQSGADSAGEEMEKLGISVRDGNGEMLPLRDIIARVQGGLAGLNTEARDQALYKLFGSDAIRAGRIFLKRGAEGLADYTAQIRAATGVEGQFATVTDTLWGQLARLWVGVQRVSIAVGKALAPYLQQAGTVLINVANAVRDWAAQNPGLVTGLAAAAVGTVALGGALVAAGLAISGLGSVIGLVSGGLSALVTVAGLLLTPWGLLAAAVAGAGAALIYFSGTGAKALEGLGPLFQSLQATATEAWQGISAAMASGDWTLAGQIAWAGLQAVWVEGVNYLQGLWRHFRDWFVNLWDEATTGIAMLLNDAWAGIKTAWTGLTNFFADTWDTVVGGLANAWFSFVRDLKDAWAEVHELLAPEAARRMRAEAAAELKAQQDEIARATKERAEGRAQEARDIEKERLGIENILAEDLLRNQERRRKAREAEEAADARAAQEARDEVASLSGRARGQGEVGTAPLVDVFGTTLGGLARGVGAEVMARHAALADAAEGAAEATQQVAKKMAVVGSFNPFAFRGLGADGGVQERTAKASEETNKHLKTLVQRVGNIIGPVFG